ncbi:MAG: PTS transporter subunit EIIC [Tissierellia bacterium]|nr:PTS transporter subunit EIIC [Tissierellia bacterium]
MSKKTIAQKEKFNQIAENLLKAVGGKENVTNITHCMTRLRFNLKDKSIPNAEEIKKIPGVIGVIEAGGQLQIIIGQTVDKVYEALCDIGGFQIEKREDDNLSKPKNMTPASIGNAILDGLAGCLTPLIPLLMAVSLFKLFVAVLGPNMLNMINESSDMYKLFTFVGDAGFYFFPIIVGYTAAKKFGATPVIAMFMGGILLHPTFLQMAAEGASIKVYGISATPQNYASTILPIILTVWVMSYVEKALKKYIPTTLKTIFAPAITVLIMLPITLAVLAPSAAFIGNYICEGLLSLSNVGGIFRILAVAIIAAVYEFLVMSGMHLVLISTLILVFTTTGVEENILPAACAASIAVSGMCLGAALRIKNKEERSLSIGYFIAGIIGGVTEPGLYGIGMRYKRPFIGMMIGAFAGGLYGAIVGLKAYTLIPVASVLAILNFAGGPTSNLVHGVIQAIISFVVAAIATYFIGFKKEDLSIDKDESLINEEL